MGNINTGKGVVLDLWKAGEPLDHIKLNQAIRQLQNMLGGVRPPRQVVPNPGDVARLTMQQFQIESILGDYLICNPWNGVAAEDSQYIIAKPPELRRSRTSWNSITFTYSDDQTRVATSGSDTEDQVVVPEYVVGDVIYAVTGIKGGTGVELDDGTAVDWLDMNVAGRAWAKDDA